MFKITHKSRNVNSKRIKNAIVEAVEEAISELFTHHNADAVMSYLDMSFEELLEGGIITSYDMYADERNGNTTEQLSEGNLKIHLKFQQFNCLNFTTFDFEVTREQTEFRYGAPTYY